MKEQRLQYLWIGQTILHDQALTWPAKIILATIDLLARNNETTPDACTFSVQQLADLLELGHGSVRHHVAYLIKHSYLTATDVVKNNKVITRELRVAKEIWNDKHNTIKIAAKHLYRTDLTWLEKALLSYIDGFNAVSKPKGNKTWGFFQKNETIAERFGTTPSTIKSVLCKLRNKGLIAASYYGKAQPNKSLRYNGTRIVKLTQAAKYPVVECVNESVAGKGPLNPVYQVPQSGLRGPQSCLPGTSILFTTPLNPVYHSGKSNAMAMAGSTVNTSLVAVSSTQRAGPIDTYIDTVKEREKETHPSRWGVWDVLSFVRQEKEAELTLRERRLDQLLESIAKETYVSHGDDDVSHQKNMFHLEADNFLCELKSTSSTREDILSNKSKQFSSVFVYCVAKYLAYDDLASEHAAWATTRLEQAAYHEAYGKVFMNLNTMSDDTTGTADNIPVHSGSTVDAVTTLDEATEYAMAWRELERLSGKK